MSFEALTYGFTVPICLKSAQLKWNLSMLGLRTKVLRPTSASAIFNMLRQPTGTIRHGQLECVLKKVLRMPSKVCILNDGHSLRQWPISMLILKRYLSQVNRKEKTVGKEHVQNPLSHYGISKLEREALDRLDADLALVLFCADSDSPLCDSSLKQLEILRFILIHSPKEKHNFRSTVSRWRRYISSNLLRRCCC